MLTPNCNTLSRLLTAAMLLGGLLLPSTSLLAQPARNNNPVPPPNERSEPMPPEAQGIGIDERMNIQLPLNAPFYNEDGDAVTLGQYFTDGKPVILQMGYFGCPKLCDLVSRSTIESLAQVDLQLGTDFKVIYVSIDPEEKPALARESKKSYIKHYVTSSSIGDGQPHEAAAAERGWHFLTGRQVEIKQLAETVGFKYRWIESAQQFSHPAVIMFITPTGTVSRYLYGAKFDPKLVKLSLVDSGAGRSGSVMDKIIMLCFHFDPNTGRYSLQAMRIMQLGGVVTVIGLLATMGLMTLKGRKLRGVYDDQPKRGLGAVMAGGPKPPPETPPGTT